MGEGPERREGPPEVCEFRSAHRRCGGCQPALRPLGHGAQHRLKGSPTGCQSIAHTHRRTRVDQPFDDAFGLELAQPLGKNAIADARYAGKQLVETSGAWKQRFDDCSRERFYALSELFESKGQVFSTRNFFVDIFSVWDSGHPWTLQAE